MDQDNDSPKNYENDRNSYSNQYDDIKNRYQINYNNKLKSYK